MSDHFDESDQNGHPPEPDMPPDWRQGRLMYSDERRWPRIGVVSHKKMVHEMRLVRLRHIPRGKWWTRDDREIPISTMDGTHLQNTISLLERMSLHRTRKYRELVAERSMRRLAEARAHRKAAKKR
jgi:hypothetical protein